MRRFMEFQAAVEHLYNHQDQLHGWNHAQSVVANAKCIFNQVDFDIDIDILLTAALLHDLHYSVEKNSKLVSYIAERKICARVTRQVLEKFGQTFTAREQAIIVQAVYNHPFSFPFRNLNKSNDYYSQILQDADTMEFFNPLRAPKFVHTVDNFVINLIRKAAWVSHRYFLKYVDPFLNLQDSKICCHCD